MLSSFSTWQMVNEDEGWWAPGDWEALPDVTIAKATHAVVQKSPQPCQGDATCADAGCPDCTCCGYFFEVGDRIVFNGQSAGAC